MDRPFQRQAQRGGGRRAAALEDMDGKGIARRLERQPQRRRRSCLRGLQRPEQRHPGTGGLGGNGQAAQLLVARAGDELGDLPAEAQAYIEFVQERTETPIGWVSVRSHEGATISGRIRNRSSERLTSVLRASPSCRAAMALLEAPS